MSPLIRTCTVLSALLVFPPAAGANDEDIAAGEALYQTVCAACHAKDLSGASGYNLKDGEWIHGSRPKDIKNSIRKGFTEAGMPAFGAMYSEEQLQQLTAFILSRREGFDDLRYRIFSLNNENDLSIEGKPVVKQGEFGNNLIDFQLPENEHFAIEVEGEFYTYDDQETRLFLASKTPDRIDIEIDGELLPRPESSWQPTWPLKPGKQNLKITFYSGTLNINQKNPELMVVDKENTIRFFPVSTRAHETLSRAVYEIKAEQRVVVLRKRVYNLPTYSISVGYPSKLNYAFNARSCAIVGVWKGDLMDVGPNITGRGTTGSKPLGDEVFMYPQQVAPRLEADDECQFVKYNVEDDPIFHFRLGEQDMTVVADASAPPRLVFHYKVLGNPNGELSLNLPAGDAFELTARNGKVTENRLTIDLDQHREFSLEINIREGL